MKKTETNTAPPVFTVSSALGLVLNTTLRLMVPSITGTILGVWADTVRGTAPLWTIVGVAVGVLLAVLLVWLQIRAERKRS